MSPNTRVSGSNSGSHSIDVSLGQFSVSSKICFCVTASLIEPKNVTVIVEGMFDVVGMAIMTTPLGNRSTSDSGYLWIEFVSLLLVTITCKFLAPV